jgi:exopolyphosphatase/guanosine-5'-triphosphate,3'-diphosphate pyrophosphatase
VALGASGTIKAAQEVLVAMGEKDGFITPERLEMLVSELLKHKNFDALSLPGLSEDRKAVFAPGLAILCGVFDALAIKELRLSDGALREGVLYEMEGRFRHQDIRSRTAQSLANQYNIDREQARRAGNHHPYARAVAGAESQAGQSAPRGAAEVGGDAP